MAHNGRLWAFDGKDRMRRNGKSGLQGLANQWTIQSVNPSLSQVRGSWLKVLKASKFSSTRGLWPDQACYLVGVLLEPVVERVVVLRLPLLLLHNFATISASHSGKVTTGEQGHQLMEWWPSNITIRCHRKVHIFGQENKVNSSPYLRRLSEAWLRPSIMVGLAGIEWG